MTHEIIHRPSFALARLALSTGDSIVAEAGAMVSMSPTISIETKARGGVMKGLARSLLGGESFFLNTFHATREGELTLAPALPGDIIAVELQNESVYVQSGSFLASTAGIELNTKWGGAKTFFSREGLFMLLCSGSGTLLLSSYGAIEQKTLAVGEEYIVDTAHIVSFGQSITYEVKSSGGLKTTLFGGEGLVCRYRGPGRLSYQSRSFGALIGKITPHIPKRS